MIVPCEGSLAWLKSLVPQAAWRDATALLHHERTVKTDREIERLRIAHRVAGFGLKAVHGVRVAWRYGSRVGGRRLYGMPHPWQPVRGVRHVNVYPQVSSGPNAHRAWRPIVSDRPSPASRRRGGAPGIGRVRGRFLGRRHARESGRPPERLAARRLRRREACPGNGAADDPRRRRGAGSA